MKRLLFILATSLALMVHTAWAADYYVGPKGTPTGGNGTQSAPFPSITVALNKAVGGDRLLLLDGNYGEFLVKSIAPTSPVVIESVNPGKAVFESISVEYRAKNLTFSKVSIIWTKAPAKAGWLFFTSWDTSGITISDSTVMAHPASGSFRTWAAADWTARDNSGISISGSGGKVLRNTIIGVAFGISMQGDDHLVEGNTVDGYSGDGLRGNGNRITFKGNRITNCVSVSGNHADGFQSFNLKAGTFFDGIVLDGNTIIEQTQSPRMALTCQLQGIGMFDGMFSNLKITNNHIEVSAYHGISVAGVVGALIDGNKVFQAPGGPQKPWIMVQPHKNGTASSGVVISNNVSAAGVKGPFAPGVNNTLTTGPAPTPVPTPTPTPTPEPTPTPTPLPPPLVLSAKMTLAEMCLLVK